MNDRSLSACAAAVAVLAVSLSLSANAAKDAAPTPEARGERLNPVHMRPSEAEPVLPETQLHPNADAALATPRKGPAVDVTTFHYDGLRTGWNAGETQLTPASVASSKFGLLKTLNVEGNVFAQPLVVSDFTMPDGSSHDVLVIATGHNTVYAFDAQSYAPLWQVNLGPSQATGDIGCEDVTPEYGISSTPVILRSGGKAAIYLVSATEPAAGRFETHLHALDLGTGKDLKAPTLISPSAKKSDGSTIAFDPKAQWSRAGLAFANGSIYVAISSHCDNNADNISGWMLRYSPRLKLENAFNTVDDPAGYELSTIWMSGFAPSVDASGNLFVITGNGASNTKSGGRNLGESVLRLPPGLADADDLFTPIGFRSLNQVDADFGSGGVMLLPTVAGQAAPPLAVAMGKNGTMYLLDQSNLGGVQANDAGALQVMNTPHGVWGGPAYFGGAGGPFVYYQTDRDVLRSYAVSTGASPSLTPAAQGTINGFYGGSMPIVTSNGQTANTGVVWVVHRGQTVQLEAYDAAKLGAPLYAAAAGSWGNTRGNAFVSALAANGRVYVPATGTVKVFGLAP